MVSSDEWLFSEEVRRPLLSPLSCVVLVRGSAYTLEDIKAVAFTSNVIVIIISDKEKNPIAPMLQCLDKLQDIDLIV